ncbi:MAG: hypothetical protein MZV70_01460 [Desulfobacterales bacterium]|nr:hypothetical protein [Desulfobacterales bacterium]
MRAGLAKLDISVDEINRNIAKLQRRMAELEPVNMKALVEYDEVQARKQELKERIDNSLANEKNSNYRKNEWL